MPKKVTAVDMAFVGATGNLLPPWNSIPEEFRNGRHPFCHIVNKWFFTGLDGVEFTPKKGISLTEALRHVKAIMVSWQPKHEHKIACCAYPLSLWFSEIKGKDK